MVQADDKELQMWPHLMEAFQDSGLDAPERAAAKQDEVAALAAALCSSALEVVELATATSPGGGLPRGGRRLCCRRGRRLGGEGLSLDEEPEASHSSVPLVSMGGGPLAPWTESHAARNRRPASPQWSCEQPKP
jgi:hypothetical protein